MNEHLSMFEQNLCVLNRSEKTVRAYVEHVNLFLKQTGVTDIRNVSTRIVNDYVKGLFDHTQPNGKPYSISTISMKIRALKRFFEYLEQSNIVFISPAESIKEPKKQKSVPRSTLSIHEVSALLEQPDLNTGTGIRDRAILEVFYSTGIRLSELCGLSILDADLNEGVLRINNGKGNKDRVVPLGKHAIRFIQEYITRVRPKQTRKNPGILTLFVNQYGQGISNQTVTVMIRSYARSAGITGKPVSAHIFRHTFASHLVQHGADCVAVQRMLGHVSLKTTQVYVRSLGIDVKKVHSITHPREHDKHDINYQPAIERKVIR